MSELSLLRDVRELISWVYVITGEYFPNDEKYGLTSQVRRASVSVALNIREGNVFDSKNKLRFFKIALGSLCEVDECLNIAKESLSYITLSQKEQFMDKHYWICLNKLKKLINSIPSKK